MKRRTFLAWLTGTAAGVAAAATLDIDKLLWVQGEKTIILPPVPTIDRVKLVLGANGETQFVATEDLRLTGREGRQVYVSGRYVVTARGQGLPYVTQVVYDDTWRALQGVSFGRQPKEWSREELAAMSAPMQDPRAGRRSILPRFRGDTTAVRVDTAPLGTRFGLAAQPLRGTRGLVLSKEDASYYSSLEYRQQLKQQFDGARTLHSPDYQQTPIIRGPQAGATLERSADGQHLVERKA
jgi:hypothetical protein